MVPAEGRPARLPSGRVGLGWRPKAVFLTEVKSSGSGFVFWQGCGEAAEKLSPEEDHSTSANRGLSRAGESPRATMQGVDLPCWIRGSWGCGPALPSPSSPAHGTASRSGWGGTGEWMRRTQTGGGWSTAAPPYRRHRRQGRRGLEEVRHDSPLTIPSAEKRAVSKG